ncbi:NUDIX domain-containing protein [Hamadaea tsunoensis]|uniref:NUDIX domain-containing protein n=1 Tax=Hamadaea tsunoensis TaxID=53368 RepID=UPI0004836260|nr:NUDIX domain-containing protein [Hamadaea tsunoensis]
MEKRRRIGAYGIARDDSDQVLLVSGSASAWHLPGGGIDFGEDPRHTVVREFVEETGYEVALGDLRVVSADFVEFPRLGALQHHDRIVFDVTVTGGVLTPEEGERAAWVRPEDVELVPFAAKILLGRDLGPEINPRTRPFEDGHQPANRVRRFGAYGLITDDAGRILLSQIAPDYPGAGRWHLPGGGTDFGEQPAEALVREVFEETGQSAQVVRLLDVSHFHNPAAMGPEKEPLDWFSVRAIFAGRVSSPTEARVTEVAGGSTAQSRWFAPGEVSALPLTDLTKHALGLG